MDPNAVVLEISSDEESGWDNHDDRVIAGGFDDNNWIAELLDEVNGGDCDYHDDSDEVVLVSEVLPSRRPRKKPTSKSSSLIELDDECMVLDHDPGKPLELRNDNSIDRNRNDDDDDDDDSDDLLVVSETGQVACRDYPHPRHLCIKFPFLSTPSESHCDQCYCYVCDSLAPCLYWGNGSDTTDHCQATEKIESWKLERQNSKNRDKLTSVEPIHEVANHLPQMNIDSLPLPPPPPPLMVQTPSVAHIPVSRPNPIRVCPVSPNLGALNINNQNRAPFLLSRNKYQPGLVSQQLIRSSSCTNPRDRGHHNYTFNKNVFKRTLSSGVASTGNHRFYSSHRDNYRNLFRQQGYRVPENHVNNSGSFPVPPSYLPFEDPFLSRAEFSPDSQPQLNSNSYVESPVPFQPQRQSSLPSYSVPCEASQRGNQNHGQRSTVDPKFFHGINWPESQMNHVPAAQTVTPENEPLLAADSGEYIDNHYDNWGYDQQPCEPGSMEIPGSFGLNEFSPEPAFLDTGTIFDF